MQPYFLPYIGYFQLMAAVDRFVILDDVNYINRGWINRNRIPSPTGPRWLTLPLVKASQNRLIRDIEILPDNGWKKGMAQTVAATYAKASEKSEVFPFFLSWLAEASGNLSMFLCRNLAEVAKYMRLTTDVVATSSAYPKNGLKGPDRILDICVREKAGVYLNLPGGRGMYDRTAFSNAGVKLQFLDPNLSGLNLKCTGTSGPVLSILDLMMLNSPAALHKAAEAYRMAPDESSSQ